MKKQTSNEPPPNMTSPLMARHYLKQTQNQKPAKEYHIHVSGALPYPIPLPCRLLLGPPFLTK